MNATELQRMRDDHIVADYMAKVDSRIDNIVLEARVHDEMHLDRIVLERIWSAGANFTDSLSSMRNERYLDSTNNAKGYWSHISRDSDLQQLIELIRANADFIEPERSFYHGPGRYDANDDRYLAYVLDYAGLDFADEDTGESEWGAFIMRFDRVLCFHHDDGSVSLEILPNEKTAKENMMSLRSSYEEWAVDQDD